MKNLVVLSILVFLLVTGVASAETTLVAGKIYNADYSDTIADAEIIVECDHDGSIQTHSGVISLWDGSYAVTYTSVGEYACDYGDVVTVTASKGDLHGQKTGVVNPDVFGTWDLAVVNVPLVPEFGFFVGALTILSATAVFFIIRRK
ncbi:hypothetical protein ACFL0X_00750 [Nanoarchaeota archaeon]